MKTIRNTYYLISKRGLFQVERKLRMQKKKNENRNGASAITGGERLCYMYTKTYI